MGIGELKLRTNANANPNPNQPLINKSKPEKWIKSKACDKHKPNRLKICGRSPLNLI